MDKIRRAEIVGKNRTGENRGEGCASECLPDVFSRLPLTGLICEPATEKGVSLNLFRHYPRLTVRPLHVSVSLLVVDKDFVLPIIEQFAHADAI